MRPRRARTPFEGAEGWQNFFVFLPPNTFTMAEELEELVEYEEEAEETAAKTETVEAGKK